MASTPSARSRQNASGPSAPGNRQPIPTMAMGSAASMSTLSRSGSRRFGVGLGEVRSEVADGGVVPEGGRRHTPTEPLFHRGEKFHRSQGVETVGAERLAEIDLVGGDDEGCRKLLREKRFDVLARMLAPRILHRDEFDARFLPLPDDWQAAVEKRACAGAPLNLAARCLGNAVLPNEYH